jgi:hypothetical protein
MFSPGTARVLLAVVATGSWMVISSYLILLNKCVTMFGDLCVGLEKAHSSSLTRGGPGGCTAAGDITSLGLIECCYGVSGKGIDSLRACVLDSNAAGIMIASCTHVDVPN